MSGSNEERTSAADEPVAPEATPETPTGEPATEMSAAEALARATEAADEAQVAPPAAVPEAEAEAEATDDSPSAPTTEASAEEVPRATETTADEGGPVPAANEASADHVPPAAETTADEDAPVPAANEASVNEVPPAAQPTPDDAEIVPEATPSGDSPVVDTAANENPPVTSKDDGEAPTAAEAEPSANDGEEASDEPTAVVETVEDAVAGVSAADAVDPAVADSAADEEPGASDEAPEAVAVDPEGSPAKNATEPSRAAETTTDETAPAATEAAPSEEKTPAKAPTKKAELVEAAPPESPELQAVREAMESRKSIEGRVIGWNHGGFHLALGELAAFCPRSEMEVGEVQESESYLDKTLQFRVLRLQGKGRRIVVSRAAHLRNEKSRQRNKLRKKLQVGTELDGTVTSLRDFGAFVDLGGAQGLVHVSEISHRRVEHPSDVLSEGQEVRVKVLKIEQGGRRISLSMRALQPDPWKDLVKRFPQGEMVKGTVERANQIGAFIELAPGVTALLPVRAMGIPREANPARVYPPGKEVQVQIVSVDPRRQRISLALEGSGVEGSRMDFKEYQRQSRESDKADGFNAMASAFRRLQGSDDD